MRDDEKAALVARVARALVWRALQDQVRAEAMAEARGIVDELEADDLETRALGWLWVLAEGAGDDQVVEDQT